jgi:hypothetical protein
MMIIRRSMIRFAGVFGGHFLVSSLKEEKMMLCTFGGRVALIYIIVQQRRLSSYVLTQNVNHFEIEI